MPRNLDWVIERAFELRKGRKQTQVLARFAKPVPDRRDFRCEFQIAGLHAKPIAGKCYGVDDFQALDLTMQFAAMTLMASRAYQSGRLTLWGSLDLQMPLSKGMRDLIRWDLESKRTAELIRSGPDKKRSVPPPPFLVDPPTQTYVRPTDVPVIVERELELRKGRKQTKVLLRFRQPVRHRYGFACAFHIDGLLAKPPSRNGMIGIDGVEALRNAMQLAMIYVLTSRPYQRGQLTWIGLFDLGLPVQDEIAPLIRKDLAAAQYARRMMRGPARVSSRSAKTPPRDRRARGRTR